MTSSKLRIHVLSTLAALLICGCCAGDQSSVKQHARLTAETNRPETSTFALGEGVEITFSLDNLDRGQQIPLNLDIRDEFGQSVAAPTSVVLQGDQDGRAHYRLAAPAERLGYYEVKAWLSDGTRLSKLGTRDPGIVTYAVVPDPATRVRYDDALSRFGLQGGFSVAAPVIPFLGVRYILAGNDWAKLEPQSAGQFTIERSKAERIGKSFPPKAPESESLTYRGSPWSTYGVSNVTVAALPTWALMSGTSGSICKKFGALNEDGKAALPSFARAQATAFAADFKGQKVRHYQVTWEPASGWCFGGSPWNLVEIYARSYSAIHGGDPHAVVAGPTLFVDSESSKQLQDLLNEGLGQYFDALALHPYVREWPPETHGLPSILRLQLQMVTKAVGHPIPFFGTEHGYQSTTVGNLKKALGDIRTTLIMLGEGASFDFGFYVADFWDGDDPEKTDGYGFYWNLNPRIKFGTNKLGPKAVVPAYAAMTYLLDGSTSKGVLPNLLGTQIGYRFVRDATTIDVIWDYGGQSYFAVPSDAFVCDWMGNCATNRLNRVVIGAAPTYIMR